MIHERTLLNLKPVIRKKPKSSRKLSLPQKCNHGPGGYFFDCILFKPINSLWQLRSVGEFGECPTITMKVKVYWQTFLFSLHHLRFWVTTQSMRELGGCGAAAKPPHHTPPLDQQGGLSSYDFGFTQNIANCGIKAERNRTLIE
jgi:hypothetical protein